MSDNMQQKANSEMEISRAAAQVSVDAAKQAAADQLAADKAKAQAEGNAAADKFAQLKEMAGDKLGGLTDKLKDMAGDALEKGADFAQNLADKLHK